MVLDHVISWSPRPRLGCDVFSDVWMELGSPRLSEANVRSHHSCLASRVSGNHVLLNMTFNYLNMNTITIAFQVSLLEIV